MGFGRSRIISKQKLFLANECQFILVVNLSNFIHESEHKRNEYFMHVDYWMKEIHKITADGCSPPVIILGAHCDLLSDKIKDVMELVLKLVIENQLNCVPFVFESSLKSSDVNNDICIILKQFQKNSEEYFSDVNSKILLQIQKNSDEYFKNDSIIDSLRLITLKQKIETQKETKPFTVTKRT